MILFILELLYHCLVNRCRSLFRRITIKRPQNSPSISPKKLGLDLWGILTAILTTWIPRGYPGIMDKFHFFPLIIIVTLSIAAQMGDLIESSAKTISKVKDTSQIILDMGIVGSF